MDPINYEPQTSNHFYMKVIELVYIEIFELTLTYKDYYYTCKKRRWGSSRRRAVKSFLELEVEICWIRRRLDVLFGWWCSSSNTNVGSENGEVRREKFFFSAPAKPLFSTRAENWKVRKLKSIICMIMTRWSSACNWFTLLQILVNICLLAYV